MARRIGGAVAAGDCFQYVGSGFSRTCGAMLRWPNDFAHKETAAFVGRIAPRVRDDGGQRFAIDSNFIG